MSVYPIVRCSLTAVVACFVTMQAGCRSYPPIVHDLEYVTTESPTEIWTLSDNKARWKALGFRTDGCAIEISWGETARYSVSFDTGDPPGMRLRGPASKGFINVERVVSVNYFRDSHDLLIIWRRLDGGFSYSLFPELSQESWTLLRAELHCEDFVKVQFIEH